MNDMQLLELELKITKLLQDYDTKGSESDLSGRAL